MSNTIKVLLLKFGIPSLAVIVIAVQFFFVNTQSLNKWKGGGYGMYTGIHYYYNQIYIPGMSVDSLIANNNEMERVFKHLKLMPNDDNLMSAAEFVIKKTHKDSIHIQIWKPSVNSKNGVYSRALVNEIYFKKTSL